MFYEEKVIREIIICPICSNKYNDPRILPCGRSMCFDCIQNIIDKNNTLNCNLCKGKHERPPNGFIKNMDLSKLLESKSKEIYRSETVEELKAKLKDLDLKSSALCNDLKNNEMIITNRCDLIKKDVSSVADRIHRKVNKYVEDMFKIIDDYQNECISKFKLNTNYQNSINNFLNEANLFYSKWNDYLTELVIQVNFKSLNFLSIKFLVNKLI